jgi:pimeloyl-ACP methyl ester carboxylesterase
MIPYTGRAMVRPLLVGRLAVLVGCLAEILGGGAMAHADPAMPAAETRSIGALTLHRCPDVDAYCGSLDRPLDPLAAGGGGAANRIAIHFEFYPRTGQAAGARTGTAATLASPEATLVATEGGPGYPATLSRADYLALFAPLRGDRDVLLMDNRGTGKSGAVDCPALQSAERWTVDGVAACGRSLGSSAALYSTAYAADDLAAVLEALKIARIDLYGDSYGTYFAQVFALRHPERLRTLVLDGAFALDGPDYAWYPNYAPAMREKFNAACRRDPACAALPGTSIEHVLPALAALRAAPFSAAARDGDGRDRAFRADASALAIVMFGSAPALVTLRELDAAARAFDGGDRLPLLRLMAETLTSVDSRDPAHDPRKWSAGLAAAVLCHDPPQIFDMRLAPDLRAEERDRLIAARERTFPGTYAPFTIDEYRGMPLDYSFIDECVAWPVAPASEPAGHVVPESARYPDVPVLVLSGELDDLTSVADGAAVAHAFPRGLQVIIENGLHVNALPRARSDCGAELVRRFVATQSPGDRTCAHTVPPLRLVPEFARHAEKIPRATPRPGNAASDKELKLAHAALLTIGDVLARIEENSSGSGKGLRGGSFLIVQHGVNVHVSLYGVRWTEDLSVSGAVERSPGRSALVRARIRIAGVEGETGELRVSWREGSGHALAAIGGNIDGHAVAATARAP